MCVCYSISSPGISREPDESQQNYFRNKLPQISSPEFKGSRNLKLKIYKNIILPVVLYGYETWCLILREDHRLTVVSDNWVLRRIFGPKREEVVEGWRTLHKERLHNLYAS
jgi:hypothetical protein